MTLLDRIGLLNEKYLSTTNKGCVEAQKYKLNWEEHLRVNRIQGSRLPKSAYLHRQSQGTERLEDKEYNGRSSFRIAKYQNWLVAPTSKGGGELISSKSGRLLGIVK